MTGSCFSFSVSRDIADRFHMKSGLFCGRDNFPIPLRLSHSVLSDKFFDLLWFSQVNGEVYESLLNGHVVLCDFVTVHLTFCSYLDKQLTVDDVHSMLDEVIGADCYYDLRVCDFDTSPVFDEDGSEMDLPRGFFKPYEVDENNVYLGPSEHYLSGFEDEDRMEIVGNWFRYLQGRHDFYYDLCACANDKWYMKGFLECQQMLVCRP